MGPRFPEKPPTPQGRRAYDNTTREADAMRKPTDAVTRPDARGPAAPTTPDDWVAEPRPEEVGDSPRVERPRAGDDAAFAALVTRYERKLIRVLNRLVHDEELARDLAQETFWRVYNRLDRFDTSRRFGPWLFRVGVNLGLDQLRRREGPPTSSIDRPGRAASKAME